MTPQQKLKKIYGCALLIISLVFLVQAITGREFIPIFEAFKYLGLSRNILILILSMFVIGIIGSITADHIKRGVMARSEANQKRANSLVRSTLISILTLWCALLVVFIFGGVKLITIRDANSIMSYMDFSNSKFFLNIYLFWYLLFSAVIGNIAKVRVITDPEEEKKLEENIKKWKSGEKSFSDMLKKDVEIIREAEQNEEDVKTGEEKKLKDTLANGPWTKN